MTHFDEYQRFLRYKYGFYSFNILLGLFALNLFLGMVMEIQCGETRELEYILLVFSAVSFFIIVNTFKGSFFQKKENPNVLAFIFFFMGLAQIYLSLSPNSPIIVDNQVTTNSFILLGGVTWLSLAIAYLVRVFIDQKRDKKESD